MKDEKAQASDDGLVKRLNLTLLTLYGLGTTIGAGIFVLIGEVAGKAGYAAPFSFLLASVLAGTTALGFAELSSRFPKSAGEAVFVHKTLNSEYLARLTGLAVIIVGIISSATITSGFINYAQDLVDIHRLAIAVPLLTLLFFIAVWGIRESVMVAALVSVVEIGTLVVLIFLGVPDLIADNSERTIPSESDWIEILPGIVSGAVLAFYAFIGFEDMVNVAEEVQGVSKTMPRAIILTLVITLVLYVCFSMVANAVLTPGALAQSKAPLSDLFEAMTGWDGRIFSTIVMAAVLNGVLIQTIMASRVLYGLTNQNWLPSWFGKVNRKRHTPVNATLFTVCAIGIFVAVLPLEILARASSSVTLFIFALINLGLLQFPKPELAGAFSVPRWICAIGLVGCVSLLVFQMSRIFVSG